MKGDFTGTPSGIKGSLYIVVNQQSMHGKAAVARGHAYGRKEAVMRQEQAAAPLRKEHGLLSENMQPESIHPRVRMIPRAQSSQKVSFHANTGYFTDLGASGTILPANCHAAKTREDMLVEKENHPECG